MQVNCCVESILEFVYSDRKDKHILSSEHVEFNYEEMKNLVDYLNKQEKCIYSKGEWNVCKERISYYTKYFKNDKPVEILLKKVLTLSSVCQ